MTTPVYREADCWSMRLGSTRIFLFLCTNPLQVREACQYEVKGGTYSCSLCLPCCLLLLLQVREACQYEVKGGAENKQGKANVLLQVGGWQLLRGMPFSQLRAGADRQANLYAAATAELLQCSPSTERWGVNFSG